MTTAMPWWPVVLCALGVAGLIVAKWRGSRAGIWVAKLTASTAFIAAAVLWSGLETPYGRLVLLGLALSWLGDVLLIPRRQIAFVAGLSFFLLGHLVYASAFLLRSQDVTAVVAAAAVMTVFGALVLRWLWPYLRGIMRPAVAAYVGAITLMVILAGGTAPALGPMIPAGAAAFAVSDVFVARHRFVSSSLVNKAVGLPLYYAAQLVLASTVAVA